MSVHVLISALIAVCDGILIVAVILYIGIPNSYILQLGAVIKFPSNYLGIYLG